jgi:molecular chaperone GrpE (heat shock protein)
MAIKLAEMSDQELANKLLEVIDSLEAVQNELKTNKEIEHPSVLTKRINDYQKKILSLN